METFLVLNGFELDAAAEEQESLIIRLAAGDLERSELVRWVSEHLVQRTS